MRSSFSILFLFISSFSFAQHYSGKVVYKQSVDISGMEDDRSMHADIIRDAAELAKNFDYQLVFNGTESLFELEDFVENDSRSLESMALRIGGGSGIYYKNADSLNTLLQEEAYGEDYIIAIPMSRYVWEITDESKEIGKYTCYKATSSRVVKAPTENLEDKIIEVEAWFSPDIPVCFGPKDINGLPGLVLEARMANVTLTASEVELENSENKIVIKKPTKGKYITFKELDDMGRKLMANRFK